MAIKNHDNFEFHDIATEYILACVLLEGIEEVTFNKLWEMSVELRQFSIIDGNKTHIYYSDISRDSVMSIALSLQNYFELTDDGIRSKDNSSTFFHLLKRNTSSFATEKISSCFKRALIQEII